MLKTELILIETTVAFFSFVVFRYFLVNYVLRIPLSVMECTIKALCFALSAFSMKMATHFIVEARKGDILRP